MPLFGKNMCMVVHAIGSRSNPTDNFPATVRNIEKKAAVCRIKEKEGNLYRKTQNLKRRIPK